MAKKAPPSGNRLSEDDAAIVKGMLERGDRQQDISAYFGVNSARVAEVANGTQFSWVLAAALADLPPPGPYLSGRLTEKLAADLASVRDALKAAEDTLKSFYN